MSKENGTDQLTKKPKDAYGKGKKGLGLLKNVKNAAKVLRFFFQKVILSFGKWLAATVGPFIIGFFVLIVLLMIVLDSVMNFDLFQQANEREEHEVVFDETVRDVFTEELEKAVEKIRNTVDGTQGPHIHSALPEISDEWLQEMGEMMKISHAIPTIHHYYKNLTNENYKPWHKSFSKKQEEKFFELITKEMAYYFEDESFEPKYKWEPVPIDEFVYRKVTTTCTVTDPETGAVSTTVTETESKDIIPPREIVRTVTNIYHEGTILYDEIHTIEEYTVASGDCVDDVYEEKQLYLVNDKVPINLKLLPDELVLFLTTDAKKGKRTHLVQAQDLEYMIDIGREADPRFPSLDIDYDGLTKCYFKKRAIPPCIDDYVKGGSLGDIFYGTGETFPGEYTDLYKAAAEACGIDWEILAGVHGAETSYSKNPIANDKNLSSSAGALGHFQFMGLTWLGWAARDDLHAMGIETTSSGKIIGETDWLYDPAKIAQYGGKGRDGDGDGIADPWNLKDAMVSSACYLRDIGYVKGDTDAIRDALAKYNQGSKPGEAGYSYADKVLGLGDKHKAEGESPIGVLGGDVTYPAEGVFTSPYGMRKLPNESAARMHYGIDIAGPMNSPIVSVADGVVTAVQSTGSGWGKIVRVQHNVNGKKFETLYAHLNDFATKVGATVSKGQQIGYMGCTGRSYSSSGSCGVHLHLEVHVPSYKGYGVSNVNPLQYVPLPPGN